MSMCLFGTPNVNSKLRLVAALYEASHFPQYLEKVSCLLHLYQCLGISAYMAGSIYSDACR